MKFVLVLACFIAVAVASDDEWVDKVVESRKHCASDPETKIDEATLEKLKHRQIDDWRVVSKYAKCMAMNMGFLEADGTIDVPHVRKALKEHIHDEEKMEEAVKVCTKQMDSPGQTAFVMITCMKDHMGPQNDFFMH